VLIRPDDEVYRVDAVWLGSVGWFRVELAKGRRTVTRREADALSGWAKEYKVPNSHGPMTHRPRSSASVDRWGTHIKINGHHIKVRDL
jgi:hypothetical protein